MQHEESFSTPSTHTNIGISFFQSLDTDTFKSHTRLGMVWRQTDNVKEKKNTLKNEIKTES